MLYLLSALVLVLVAISAWRLKKFEQLTKEVDNQIKVSLDKFNELSCYSRDLQEKRIHLLLAEFKKEVLEIATSANKNGDMAVYQALLDHVHDHHDGRCIVPVNRRR